MSQKSGYLTHFEIRVLQAIECPPAKKSFEEIHDDAQKGLLVRVYKSGKAAYYAYLYDSVSRRKSYEKIADYADLPLDKARRTVADRLQRVAHKAADGESYVEEKQVKAAERKFEIKRSRLTLRKAMETYIDTKGLSTSSVKDYRNTLSAERNSADVLDDPLSNLTLEWTAERFKTIYERSPAIAHKWRRYLHAVMSSTAEAHPDLFAGKLPIPRKRALRNFVAPGRKSNRLAGPFFPELRKRLLEADDYDRDYLLITLFTGMRSGAVMRLRYDMTINQRDQTKWREGVIYVYDATEDKPARELVISDAVRAIIVERQRKYGGVSPWLFWSRQYKGKHPEKRCVDDRDIFARLDAPDNMGNRITAHDLRRTSSYIARAVLRVDPVIVARLHLQSTKNMPVPDGYVSPDDKDLRRETNRITEKIRTWMRSTPEEIEREIAGSERQDDVVAFEL